MDPVAFRQESAGDLERDDAAEREAEEPDRLAGQRRRADGRHDRGRDGRSRSR
jgi:hypothetical protein